MGNQNAAKKVNFQKLAVTAMLAALATVMYFMLEVPVVPGAPHLKANFADVPALIGGIAVSPAAALAILGLRCIFHLFRTSTMGIGEAVDFIIGVFLLLSFIIPYKKISKKRNTKLSFGLAAALCIAATIIGGFIGNSIFYPIFMLLLGSPLESPWVLITYLGGTVFMNLVRSIATLAASAFFIPAVPAFKKILK